VSAASPDRERKLQAIESAVGPAPWYWQTFPTVTAASGRTFEWTYHGDTGDLAYLVTLNLAGEPDRPRLALNSYCRPFLIPPYYLGVWCPEGRGIRLVCFYPDELLPFPFLEIAGWFKPSEERMYATTEPVAELEFSSALAAGSHAVKVPTQFRTVEELLPAGFYPRAAAGDAAFAIYRLQPRDGAVEVLPQDWFTSRDFDVGRQWITRVVRDPQSGRLLGEAFRAGCFQLAEGGRSLEEWLSRSA
jgi:hypothetical protein